MDPEDLLLRFETRCHFLDRCRCRSRQNRPHRAATGDGTILAGRAKQPLATQGWPLPAKAKSVIYFFMAGAPSQFELYDYKPALQKHNHQSVPESVMPGKRFAFMDSFAKDPPKLLGTSRAFKQDGRSGAWVRRDNPMAQSFV